jgi:hypothetical protein
MSFRLRQDFCRSRRYSNPSKPVIDSNCCEVSNELMKARFPLIALLTCAGCSDVCQNTNASRNLSPDGTLAAVLFQRDCGATTGFSTQVSILEPNEIPKGSGNAFIADDDHGAARVGSWNGSWAETKWLAPDHLLIRYAAKSRLFKQNDRVSGVRITYQVIGG